MAKKFKLTIVVETTDDFEQDELTLLDDEVVDGFLLTRNTENITDEFKMNSAYIQNIQEL